MSLINTNDPTTIGLMLMSVIIVVGALILTRTLRNVSLNPLKDLVKTKSPHRNISAANSLGKSLMHGHGEQPHRQTAVNPAEHSAPDNAPYNQQFDGQWQRITDRIDDNIARIRTAATDQTHAITQLDAAEFSLSELFREFPDARKQLNPVTYLEFPALKARHTEGENEHTTDGARAATA